MPTWLLLPPSILPSWRCNLLRPFHSKQDCSALGCSKEGFLVDHFQVPSYPSVKTVENCALLHVTQTQQPNLGVDLVGALRRQQASMRSALDELKLRLQTREHSMSAVGGYPSFLEQLKESPVLSSTLATYSSLVADIGRVLEGRGPRGPRPCDFNHRLADQTRTK